MTFTPTVSFTSLYDARLVLYYAQGLDGHAGLVPLHHHIRGVDPEAVTLLLSGGFLNDLYDPVERVLAGAFGPILASLSGVPLSSP